MDMPDFDSSPPWGERCMKCDGEGAINFFEEPLYANIMSDNYTTITCPRCSGKKWLKVFYTPEQWEEAGGTLTDCTPVLWRYIGESRWHLDFLEDAPENTDDEEDDVIIVIATPAGPPPRDWNPIEGKFETHPESTIKEENNDTDQ